MESFFDDEGRVVTKPVREIVYEYIRKAIVTGELPQGHRFKDTELAARFGVSRIARAGKLCFAWRRKGSSIRPP